MNIAQLSFTQNKWSAELPQALDSSNTLVLVYYSPKLAGMAPWGQIKETFPSSVIMGCSTSGEIRESELVDESLIVTITKFDRTQLRFASVSIEKSEDSIAAGTELAQQFPQKGLKSVYLLSEGTKVNGTALLEGLRKVLGEDVLVSGGLAGDGTDFKQTSVLVGGSPTTHAITAIGFYGDQLNVSTAAKGGWTSFGPIRTITRSEANVVFELDGKPALALYKEFLGNQVNRLPASALLFPMRLIGGKVGGGDRNAVRTILAVDEKTQSMTFAGDVPQGTEVQLMRSSHEKLIEAADSVAKETFSNGDFSKAPVLSLIVSCVGRRLVLGESTESEVEAVFDSLPQGSTQAGFYSYGEIAPQQSAQGQRGCADLHNQTMTVTLLQEKAG